jgi:hypothetical protein
VKGIEYGKIYWYDPRLKYGFIWDYNMRQIFFHFSDFINACDDDLKTFAELHTNVRFLRAPDPRHRHKTRATRVEPCGSRQNYSRHITELKNKTDKQTQATDTRQIEEISQLTQENEKLEKKLKFKENSSQTEKQQTPQTQIQNSMSGECSYVTGAVNDVKQKFLIDTGASHCLIDSETFTLLSQTGATLRKCPANMTTADGSKTAMLGIVSLKVRIGNLIRNNPSLLRCKATGS